MPITRRESLRDENFIKLFFQQDWIPSVGVIVPMHNEKKSILHTIRNLLCSDYPQTNIILVNDGSTDGTLYYLKQELGLKLEKVEATGKLTSKKVTAYYQSTKYKNITLIDKFSRGLKADALNAGINYSNDPLVITIDADTIVARDAISKLVIPMFFHNREYAGVGGALLTQNHCYGEYERKSRFIELYQLIEYLRAFLIGRVAMNRLGGNFISSGAVSMFFKERLMKEGGFNINSIGEDMDIVMQIYKNDPSELVFYIPDTVAYTIVPHRVQDVISQRSRWHMGLLGCLYDHKKILLKFNQGYRSFFVFPYFLFVEMFSAVVEFLAYPFLLVAYLNGYLDSHFFIFLFSMTIMINMQLTAISVFYEKIYNDDIKNNSLSLCLVLLSLTEFFGYRQILLYAKVTGIIKSFERVLFRKVHAWQVIQR